ncbi:hypothetical protein [Nocardia sp. NPDC005978]|uniref:hypothetical protein n=1 Tax=unclassified Nocardia TaxID=2637762 RepID=UPI0033B5C673
MVNDVEKRWNDPGALRRAARYVIGVLIVAAVAAVIVFVWAAARNQCLEADTMLCDSTARVIVGLVPGGVLLAGGVGAFVITIREWAAGRTWPIWQGAGWFLLTLMVAYLSIAGSAG